MRIVRNPQEQRELDSQLSYWVYGALDCVGTRQCFDLLFPQLSPQDRVLYYAARAFEAPCLAMTLRGTRIDENERRRAIAQCEKDEAEAINALNTFPDLQSAWDIRAKRPAGDVCSGNDGKLHGWEPRGADPATQVCKHCGGDRLVGQAFNPHSPSQCARLLYDIFGLKRRYSRKPSADGTRKVTTDDEALEALALKYPERAPLIDRILAARNYRKQLGALRTYLDPDGRWRASFSVCAAKTGRMASSASPYGTGANMQNIADKNRGIFIADPGLEVFYADLEQAESLIVAHTSKCVQDIADHAAGDTHTLLAQTLFPSLPWARVGQRHGWCDGRGCADCGGTGRWTARMVADAHTPWDENHEYRHYAKITRHGTNIGMSGNGIARELHIKPAQGKSLREAYFLRYPENEQRQMQLRRQIRETGVLVGPLGNTRRFLGRLWDDNTQREGLAQIQQSTIAWHLNLAMLRIWAEMDTRLNIGTPPRPSDPNRVWLLAQVHDAILGLRRPGDDDAMRRVRDIMQLPILINGRPVSIRAEIQVGRSWAHSDLHKLAL